MLKSSRPISHLFVLGSLLALACGSPAPAASPAAAAPPAPSVDTSVLRLASTPWVPFTGEEGQPRVASYLVERALERAGYKSRTTIVPDGALTPALEKGSFDGSAALWASEGRKEYLLYSEPYLENRLLLVGRVGADVSAKSFAELKGKKVAIVEGYAYGSELESAKEPIFVRVKNAQENVRAVVNNQVDYCLLDALVIEFLLEQYPKEASRLQIGSNTLLQRTLHFAVRKAVPEAELIIKRFNAVVKEMARDGTYNRELQVRWIMTDVDGDGRAELVHNGQAIGTAPPSRSYQLFQGEPLPQGGSPRVVSANEQTRYYVNGHSYNSWDEIPDSLKLQPGGNTVGGGHPQVNLFEW